MIPRAASKNWRLLEQSRRLLEFLESGIAPGDPIAGARLAEVSYTLQVGREPMAERVSFVVRSREELITALHAFVAGDQILLNCHRGHSESRLARAGTQPRSERRQEIEMSIASRDLATLASLWASGLEIDWNRLYAPGARQRVHLPTYPFARERYWISPSAEPITDNAGRARLHPLVHGNTCDLSEQRFSSMFKGEEFFLAGHRIGGERLLPAVADLDLGGGAGERSVWG